MGFKQIRNFNPSAMGTRQGYCLQNARLGFGISSGTYPSAKADMQAQKKNGTFHAGNPPTSIAVPVYCDTASKFEHVVVSDHGTVYSDGKRIPNGLKAYTPAAALGNYYGPNLAGAIKEFQRRTGLVADGNTGPITYKKLQSFGFKG